MIGPLRPLRAAGRATVLAGVLITLGLSGCERGADSGAPPERSPEREGDIYLVHFLRSEEVVAVPRAAPSGGFRIEEALTDLLRGPSPEEREEGLVSAFGSAGPAALDSVRVTEEGRVVVDFGDLPAAYPSGSASAAGEALLEALNRTVFQFPRVREAEYRVLGSCDAFWNWLQRECAVVGRDDGIRSGG